MTKNSIALNRTLFLEDNLPVLRGLDSDSIDLIATDPPFNKGVGAFEGTTKAGVDVEFKDVWNWNDDVQTEWLEKLEKKHPRLFNMIHYVNQSAGDDMGAFLCWMAVRVLEMHRVLKPTGSMYLHCDPTASHYLKAMMDAVFGRKNFRNEITWVLSPKSLGARQFPRGHDVILMYSKTDERVWNPQYLPHNSKYLKGFRHEDVHGRWAPENLSGGKAGSESAYEPFGNQLPPEGRAWAPPVRSRFPESAASMLPEAYEDMSPLDKCYALDSAGLIYWSKSGKPYYKKYLSTLKGRPVTDTFADIAVLAPTSKERTGYPTQKPLKLYKRMIEASSNPGDMVLDPFAGCATTCVAAEQLGRQWVGIDIQEKAGNVIRERLQNEVNGSMAWNVLVRTPTEAPTRTDDGDLAAPDLVVVSTKRNARKIPVQEARRLLIERDGQRCQGCGWEPRWAEYLQVDHKKPRTLKGKDDMTNYALLCDPCNRKKSNKLTLTELQHARLAEPDRMNMEWWEKEEKWKLGDDYLDQEQYSTEPHTLPG